MSQASSHLEVRSRKKAQTEVWACFLHEHRQQHFGTRPLPP